MTSQERVLAYVNRLRAKLDAEPLEALSPGNMMEADSCPVASSLPAYAEVDLDDIVIWETGRWGAERLLKTKPPLYVAEFIQKFDDGKYPELIA